MSSTNDPASTELGTVPAAPAANEEVSCDVIRSYDRQLG